MGRAVTQERKSLMSPRAIPAETFHKASPLFLLPMREKKRTLKDLERRMFAKRRVRWLKRRAKAQARRDAERSQMSQVRKESNEGGGSSRT